MAVDVIPSIAERYHISVDAARQVERALRATGGRQAQFDHADLGGMGQWAPGMVQVGRMGDHQLKHRVAGLCAEIAAIVCGSDTAGAGAFAREPGTPPAASRVDMAAGESWWPADYGTPAASGRQQGLRYAYFPVRRCLLVENGARIDCYETGDHQIVGVSQQQSHTSTLAFTSQLGEIKLDQLRCRPVKNG